MQRYKLLYGEGVIPKQQMDTQQAQVGQFDGSIKTDQATIDSAKLQLSFTRVTAPISGRVGLRLVDAGNMVHASDPGGLLVITQLQPISVIFSLPQDQLPPVITKLHAGGNLPVDAFDRDNTEKIATGTLASVDNQIDTTTGTYKLKALFSNADNKLFPNQFVNVHLLVDTKRGLTIVPVAAIQRGPQGTYVYAVDSNNVVKIRNITIAQTTDTSAGLSGGIESRRRGGHRRARQAAGRQQGHSQQRRQQSARRRTPMPQITATLRSRRLATRRVTRRVKGKSR